MFDPEAKKGLDSGLMNRKTGGPTSLRSNIEEQSHSGTIKSAENIGTIYLLNESLRGGN